jgi:putative transcriptional regulator
MPKSEQYIDDGAFSELMEGLAEVVEHAKGNRPDLRTTTFSIPDPPAPMGKDQIVELRTALRCSQAMFAKALNVSKRTVEAWEQGLREPGDASLRLLEIARKHPSVMFGRAVQNSEKTLATRATVKKNIKKTRRAG